MHRFTACSISVIANASYRLHLELTVRPISAQNNGKVQYVHCTVLYGNLVYGRPSVRHVTVSEIQTVLMQWRQPVADQGFAKGGPWRGCGTRA